MKHHLYNYDSVDKKKIARLIELNNNSRFKDNVNDLLHLKI